MPASTRRAVGALVAVLGIVLAVAGAWVVVMLGPSGEAPFSTTSKAPGAIVVPPDVLNAVDSPVKVTASRGDGGPVLLAVAPSSDAAAILDRSAVSTVRGVHFPARTLDLRPTGAGELTDISTADVWRLAAKGSPSAGLLVEQGRGPETVVVTSGDATALSDVTVTLSWSSRAWFFEALALAMIGAVLATFALNDLWQSRTLVARTDVAETDVAETDVAETDVAETDFDASTSSEATR